MNERAGNDHGHGHGHVHGEAHGHGHGDGEDIDWEAMGVVLERGAELHAPFHENAAAWLGGTFADAPVRGVLDVGSGPGVISSVLARAFPEATVLAVDGAPALLERAADRAARLGLGDRLRTLHADLPDGLDGLDPVDLIWAGQFVHHLGDQQSALHRLGALLRPGGLLAVVEGGLPARYLPRDIGMGRPGLQSRLDAVSEDWFTRMRDALPDSKGVVEDWPGLLAGAGLAPAGSRTFLLDLPAPLGTRPREYVHAELARLRDAGAEELDGDDLATVDRLLDPDDEAGLMRRPDVFLLDAKTVHTARAV